jgi:hypothetical protein
MRKSVGLHPLATLAFAAVLAGSAWAATNFLPNGGFEGGTPFSDWQTVSNVTLRSFPSSPAPFQGAQVAEVASNGGLLVSKVFVPSRSSVVLALSGYLARSPELNTTSAKPVSGQNQAVIRIRSTSPLNPNRHVAFFTHSQDRFGRVDDGTGTGAVGLKWKSFNVFFRVNGGSNTISIEGIRSPDPQPAAGRGMLLDGLNLRVVAN